MDFKINDFEGPLDLLLHLIKESKMDIMNIEIEVITDQYMNFLKEQEKMNLEISSEYLVLASELLEIKSKLLIPNNKLEEVEEEDPREELINRLLEYEAYKNITKVLQEKELLRKDIYTKYPENINNYIPEDKEIHSDVSLDDLIAAFQKYYQRQIDNRPLNTKVTLKEITVSSRRSDIKRLLKSKKKLSFTELFPVMSKEYVVATFLAILEMAKNRELKITQDEAFDDIICEVI
ncbi:MAG: segregation/condensation protein A [Bacilli bacterium]|nr:segregation/condensation protein A [Bacilli bacterium]